MTSCTVSALIMYLEVIVFIESDFDPLNTTSVTNSRVEYSHLFDHTQELLNLNRLSTLRPLLVLLWRNWLHKIFENSGPGFLEGDVSWELRIVLKGCLANE